MKPEQVQRRAERQRKREYRAERRKNKNPERDGKKRNAQKKKPRPCCGRHNCNCSCKPPKGMKKMQLTALTKRYAITPLHNVRDTTDVSVWQQHMQHATEQLPLRVLLAYAHTHVVFNQEPLLKAFIDRKAFLFKAPWFDCQMLQSIVQKHKNAGNIWRSSNYRSLAMATLRPQSHIGKSRQIPTNGVARDVLA